MSGLSKLALHPASNYVLAKCVLKLNEIQFENFLSSMTELWPRIMSGARAGVLKAAIERGKKVPSQQHEAVKASDFNPQHEAPYWE